MPKTEVLSPAGSYEALVAAVRGGCDAVYVGAKEFSARANAKNFDAQELKKAADYCHLHNVKIYQAINTVVLDQQLPQLYETLKTACEIGIDAIIVQDLAVAFAVKELCPSMPLHASTQMTIHSESGILFAKNCGFERGYDLIDEKDYEKLTNMINADSINYSPPKTLSNKEIVRLLNEIKNGR